MDINLLIAIILALILICFSIDYDDGFVSFVIGFISIMIVFNLRALFDISTGSYLGFGQLIQLIYAFIGIFSFAKLIMSGNQEVFMYFRRSRH